MSPRKYVASLVSLTMVALAMPYVGLFWLAPGAAGVIALLILLSAAAIAWPLIAD